MTTFSKFLLSVISSLGLATPALTQQTDRIKTCEEGSGFDQFDFWVGEWRVFSTNGPTLPVGHNIIEKRVGGCLILESWTNTAGTGGVSLRHYNPATDSWNMFWVSDGYTVKTEGNEVEPGEVVLEGQIHYFASGEATAFRVRFSARPDGTVQQFAEQLNKETRGKYTIGRKRCDQG